MQNTADDTCDDDLQDDPEEQRPISPVPPLLKRRRTASGPTHPQSRGKIVGLVPFWRAVDGWLKTFADNWGHLTDAAEWKQ